MRTYGAYLVLLSMFALLLMTPANAQDIQRDGLKVIEAGVDAKPISRPPPAYPRKAAKRGVEGWVIISFTVETDGSVSNVTVLDQSISNYFEKEALSAPLRWKYEPATIDGQPVIQSKKRVIFTFILEGMPKGATREFINYYRKASDALENDDLTTLEIYIQKIHEKSRLNYYETQFLYALKAQLDLKRSDKQSAIENLERVVYYSKGMVDKATLAGLANQLFLLQIEADHLVDALYTYKWIEWFAPVADESELYFRKSEIVKTLESDQPIAFKGKIVDNCQECEETKPMWIHDLYRKQFSFDQVVGKITEFKLYCGFHWQKIVYEPDVTYTRGDKWGSCDIYVYGTQGTTFRLIERH